MTSHLLALDTSQIVGGAITAVLIAATFAAWRWLWPWYKSLRSKASAITETLIGREAYTDKVTGVELVPARPGIGHRLANIEASNATRDEQMSVLTSAVARIAESHERLEHVEAKVESNTGRIKALEDAAVERVVTRAEAAAAWRAVEAVAGERPDEEEQ